MNNSKREGAALIRLPHLCKGALGRIARTGNWSKYAKLRRGRVPAMRQTSASDCGAACLAMVLSYYGRKTTVAECREQMGIGRDGVTARTIVQAAQTYGLRVRAFSLEPRQLQVAELPAIIHWNFNHFVVLEHWSPTSFRIVDPAFGRRQLTAAEFGESFTGVTLTFEPGSHFERRKITVRPFWRSYLSDIWHVPGNRRVLIQIFGVSMLLQMFGLALPLLTKIVVDYVIPFQVVSLMTIFGIGAVLIVLTQFVTSYLRAVLLLSLQKRLDSRSMIGFFEHVLSLPFRFFEQRSSGDLLMRLESNIIIREILTNQTISLILDGSLVAIYIIILTLRAPFFGALVLGIALLQIALLLTTTGRMHNLMQRNLVAQSESQSYLVEALNNITLLKASGAEDRILSHWSNLYLNRLNLSLQRSHLAAVIESALTALRIFAPIILLWFGTRQVLAGTMDLGTMLALNVLASAFLTPLTMLMMRGQELQLVGAHLERIADVVRAAPERDAHATLLTPRISGRIDIKDLSFRYTPNAPLVLHDVSVSIAPGQKIALVGHTGSGKTTFIKLLLGLYEPVAGEIVYDGQPLPGLNYHILRNQFGVVPQESFLFSGSIRQNIAFNDPGLSLEQIMEAARLAMLHDEIMQLPMGYETLLSEGGTGLSGGQRQRLSIARALAHRPTMLILDEATSHLDVVTEALVDQSLNQLACTRLVIAHRLSTIHNADLILVFDHGTIVERGSHDELLARNGMYAELIRHQLLAEAAPTIAHRP